MDSCGWGKLSTQQEPSNREDYYAMTVMKPGSIMRHVPRETSNTCFHFISHDGDISCKITGTKHLFLLLKCGLGMPCVYTFKGKSKLVDKVTTFLKELKL